ncbi:D-Ala-D-Ala carboxypeptidase family metallohydrolase [Eubacterium sp. 1001713B170207_170306_E7]|uniref:YcbK family protein n=1 Tax=Eubacterium sp. 1001713B170207_170306_E7 TaxID=2787097 RepID=UPI001897FD26|nr:D-Ala-D-Ala carboxypeptidase family metallohydrolase [Eubacterium sp. 1001713B170207_170306_E7]
MKKFYKRIFMTLAILLVFFTSGIFLVNFQGMPEAAPEVAVPEVITPAPQSPDEGGVDTRPEPEAEAPSEVLEPQASEHFLMSEYACDCAGFCDGWPCTMNPELLEKIEALRCTFGCPVIITSGVRCAARNEEVGGVSWSFHKRGCAADLYCPGVAVGDLALAAGELGMNVLPYYSQGYLHVEIKG